MPFHNDNQKAMVLDAAHPRDAAEATTGLTQYKDVVPVSGNVTTTPAFMVRGIGVTDTVVVNVVIDTPLGSNRTIPMQAGQTIPIQATRVRSSSSATTVLLYR